MPSQEDPSEGQIVLNGGQTIRLAALDQSRTYGGMLEGYPNSRTNRWLIENSLERLRRGGRRAHLIEPTETEFPDKTPVGKQPWLELSSIKCIGCFESKELGEFGSRLIILWFQPRFAMPIDGNVLQRIREIDWNDLAEAIDDF